MAAASALMWVRHSVDPERPQRPGPQVEQHGLDRPIDFSPLLGAVAPLPRPQAEVPASSTRLQLIGVVSTRSPSAAREGLAVIVVDGKPPRAFRVGTMVDSRNILQAVHARGVTLGPRGDPTSLVLELKPPFAAEAQAVDRPTQPLAAPVNASSIHLPGVVPRTSTATVSN